MLKNLLIALCIGLTTFTASSVPTNLNVEPKAPVCYKDHVMMNYHEVKNGGQYSRSEGCIHHTFGTDRVWYQDYNTYYECPICGLRSGNSSYTVEVGRDCFGYN